MEGSSAAAGKGPLIGRLVSKPDLNSKYVPELLKEPAGFYEPKGKDLAVSTGDREMLSSVIGVYAFVPGVSEQIRYISFMIGKVRGLLVKKGSLSPYKELLRGCREHWSMAVSLAHNEEGTDLHRVMIILSEIEDDLHVIIEKEGLTANSRDAFRGEVLMPQAGVSSPQEQGPQELRPL